MNTEFVLDATYCGRLCMGLVHSLWQSAAIAITVTAAGRLPRMRSAQARYIIHVVGLMAVLMAFVATLAVSARPEVRPVETILAAEVTTGPVTWSDDQPATILMHRDHVGGFTDATPAEPAGSLLPAAGDELTSALIPQHSRDNRESIARTYWRRAAPALLAGYGFGVVVMLLRLARGIRAQRRFTAGAPPVDDPILLDFITHQSRLWALRVQPKLYTVSRLTVPRVAGLLRPVIYLPAAMLTGLTGEELRLVIAHELAHVRRYDLCVNLLQRVIEVVLFFNPAVWFLSRRTSTLREFCCDDMVCRSLTPLREPASVRYARALLHVAEISCTLEQRGPLAGLLGGGDIAAAGALGRNPSELKRRIGRLLDEPVRERLGLSRSGIAIVAVLTVALVVGPTAWPYASPTDPAATSPADVQTSPAKSADDPGGKTSGDDRASAVTEKPAPLRAKGHSDDPSLGFRQVRVRAIQAETGTSLPGVRVKISYRRGKKHFDAWYAMDEHGTADVEIPINRGLNGVELEARPERLVPVYYSWSNSSREIAVPDELELRFARATTIGGRIVNEAGEAVARAAVELQLPATFSESPYLVFTVQNIKTDDDGRWQCDTAPMDLAHLGITVKRPGYLRAGISATDNEKALRDLTAITIMRQGLSVTGRVTDETGKPIADARAMLGIDRWGSDDPSTLTDADGQFVLRNCKPGLSAVTIMAEGFAPDLQRIVVRPSPHSKLPANQTQEAAANDQSLHFVLKPAGRIRGRVVDSEGRPVPGASVNADTWRGQRSINWDVTTDAQGRFDWTSAPHDTVQFDINKVGYLAARRVPLSARDDEYEIVLWPTVIVTGHVVDGQSGKAIDNFRIIPGTIWQGEDRVWWQRGEAMAFSGGHYKVTFREPLPRAQLRVEAEGYQPAESERFALEEGSRTIEFQLKRSAGFGGIVTAPDGTPATGADVVLLDKGGRLSLRNSRYDRDGSAAHTKTDQDGRFLFNDIGMPALLVAIHEKGYGELLTDRPAVDLAVPLQAWGRIEGQMFIGEQPAANQPVNFIRLEGSGGSGFSRTTVRLADAAAALAVTSEGRPRPPASAAEQDQQAIARTILANLNVYIFDNRAVRTGPDGRFAFENVIPGRVAVTREFIVDHGRSRSHTYSHGQELDVEPGKTGSVVLGGVGRPVVGKIKIPLINGKPYDWTENETVAIHVQSDGRSQGAARQPFHPYYHGFVAADGSFRIDDVPSGDYELSLRITPPSDSGGCGFGDAIGMVSGKFTVPAISGGKVRSDEPVDIGELEATMFPRLEEGQTAPSFDLTTLDGKPVSLAAFRGQIVFIDFWATWCGPCIAELPNLQELHTAFKDDPRFVMLGMALDQKREPLDEFLKSRPLAWPQVWLAEGTSSQLAKDYAVRSIPATFLIGSDGRVVARGLRGEPLRQAIAQALQTLPRQPATDQE